HQFGQGEGGFGALGNAFECLHWINFELCVVRCC
ncbi:MAG: hypothetical protein ACI9F9_001693, partial [Candidatus Paceibacteria bacterium]